MRYIAESGNYRLEEIKKVLGRGRLVSTNGGVVEAVNRTKKMDILLIHNTRGVTTGVKIEPKTRIFFA